jgi:hypothetical protein
MTTSTFLAILGLLALIAFIVFAFRQGYKVKKPPEGTPPENYGGGVP